MFHPINLWFVIFLCSVLFSHLAAIRLRKSPHFVFCIIVNIAWAGLRAGYITREEVDAYNASLVPLAQAKYADWNAYFNDFLAGRKAWDPQDESGGAAEMEEVVKDLLDNEASIYKVVPFK